MKYVPIYAYLYTTLIRGDRSSDFIFPKYFGIQKTLTDKDLLNFNNSFNFIDLLLRHDIYKI